MVTPHPPQPLTPARTAVLALDLTEMIVEHYATDGPAAVGNAATVIEAARTEAAKIVHVLPGGFTSLDATWPAGRPHPAVAPQDGELVLAKARIGAFSTTGLEVHLRAEGRDTLVLTGIATSGVVLSTARAGYDLGYRVVVVDDACSDPDRSVHEALVRPVHPDSWLGLWRIAEITTAAEIVEKLRSEV
ncbi:isochorismatase family cysteine hydrolase [Streptomyces sp. NPDC005811]|uniref:cysteine hydrolase family protein n=1 Tax=Streptomyces sp. NPDC005811 TaxID=3154565 RepID=UPI0033E59DFE